LAEARERCNQAIFCDDPEALPGEHFGIVVLANVLHHVPPPKRAELVEWLRDLLRPARGRLVVFEHNPYNPLTRRAVAQCEFDDDAILLAPGELVQLLSQCGFKAIHRRFIVFFPRALAALRPLEPSLGWLPLGAQMMVVGTSPG
jgi:SAM-dependent methyltransferase